MSHITAEDYELLGFFETEPVMSEKDIPWVYNDSTYKYNDSVSEITFSIHPSYRDLSFELKQGTSKLLEFSALGIEDVSVKTDSEGEILELKISSSQKIEIRVKPFISIVQNARENT